MGFPLLAHPLLERANIVKHGFSTRLGGVSTGDCTTMDLGTGSGDAPEAVEENKGCFCRCAGSESEDFTFTYQTHTHNVAVVREEGRARTILWRPTEW